MSIICRSSSCSSAKRADILGVECLSPENFESVSPASLHLPEIPTLRSFSQREESDRLPLDERTWDRKLRQVLAATSDFDLAATRFASDLEQFEASPAICGRRFVRPLAKKVETSWFSSSLGSCFGKWSCLSDGMGLGGEKATGPAATGLAEWTWLEKGDARQGNNYLFFVLFGCLGSEWFVSGEQNILLLKPDHEIDGFGSTRGMDIFLCKLIGEQKFLSDLGIAQRWSTCVATRFLRFF